MQDGLLGRKTMQDGLLGRKTMEAEILREALEQTRPRKLALRLPSPPPGGSR
jgi:transposase